MKACKFIRGVEKLRGKQGLDCFAGNPAETAGSEGICMHLLAMPPGAIAKAHSHDTAIFMLDDVIELAHGQNLEHIDRARPGTSSTAEGLRGCV